MVRDWASKLGVSPDELWKGHRGGRSDVAKVEAHLKTGSSLRGRLGPRGYSSGARFTAMNEPTKPADGERPLSSVHLRALLSPRHLYGRSEILMRPSPVPPQPGIYGWYMRGLPVDVSGCHRHEELSLVYVGIAPKAPSLNRSPSQQNLRKRIRYHFRGNAEGSTLRLTLGVLLSEQLGIRLQRVGSGKRLTFTADGEKHLSSWMEQNAFVTWAVAERPWELEAAAFPMWDLPLNLAGNSHHRHHAALKAARDAARTWARMSPIWTR